MKALEAVTIVVPAGQPFGVAIDHGASVPVSPLTGQGWWCVVANPTPLYLQVFDTQGGKWVPPYVADVFGSNCDVIQPLYIVWVDYAAGGIGGTITLSWATEPDNYGPGLAAYPGALG